MLVGLALGVETVVLHVLTDPLADVHAYYDAGARLNAGQPLYDQPAGVDEAAFYRYPPLLAILFRPLALLPFGIAAAIWMAAIGAMLVATLYRIDLRRPVTLFVVCALALPTGWALVIGQAQVAVTFLLAIATPWSVALAANLKVFPILAAVWWLGRRDWRALGELVGWLVALAVVQVVLEPTGSFAYPAFLRLDQVGSVVSLSPYALSPWLWAGLLAVVATRALVGPPAIRLGGCRRRLGSRLAPSPALPGVEPGRGDAGPRRPVTARGGRPSVARGALLILGVVGWVGLIWIGATLYSSTPPKAGFDLELLLRAGRDVAAGRSPYDPALVAGTAPVAESLFYSYPPVVAQAMTLVGWVPSPVALVAWGVAAVAGLAAVAIALARRFAPGRTALEVALPVIALAPLCFPFAIGLLFGNFDVFFPLLYGAMLLAVTPGARRETVTSGGVALAVAAIAKLHPASLGAWFGVRGLTGDRRAARVFVIAAVVGVAALAASLVIGGVGPWADYLAVVRAGSNADLVDPRNAGPAAQLALLLGGDDRFARTAQIGVTAAVLGFLGAAVGVG